MIKYVIFVFLIVISVLPAKVNASEEQYWELCISCSSSQMISIAKSLTSDGRVIFITSANFAIQPVKVSSERLLPNGSPIAVLIGPLPGELSIANNMYQEKLQIQERLVGMLSADSTMIATNLPYFGHPLDSAHSVAGSGIAKRALEDAVATKFSQHLFTNMEYFLTYLEFSSGNLIQHLTGLNISTVITAKFDDGSTYDLKIVGFKSTVHGVEIIFEVVNGSGNDGGYLIPEMGRYWEVLPVEGMLTGGGGGSTGSYFDNAVNAVSSGLSSYNFVNTGDEGSYVNVCTGTYPAMLCRQVFISR